MVFFRPFRALMVPSPSRGSLRHLRWRAHPWLFSDRPLRGLVKNQFRDRNYLIGTFNRYMVILSLKAHISAEELKQRVPVK